MLVAHILAERCKQLGERTVNANRAAGTSSLADDDSFQITGVQMEVGSVATEFEHRTLEDELAACQIFL